MEKCDKKCYYKFNMTKKKEIGNLNASNSDTLTRSQSLNKKIILNSSNSSQECINNLVSFGNIKNKALRHSWQ